MMGNYQVRFLGGKGAAMPPTYPIEVTNDKKEIARSFYGSALYY